MQKRKHPFSHPLTADRTVTGRDVVTAVPAVIYTRCEIGFMLEPKTTDNEQQAPGRDIIG